MPVVINGTTGIETPGVDADPGSVLAQTLTVNSNNISAVNSLGFRNRIINGAMVIDQRNAGASVTPTTSGTYLVDRWLAGFSQSSKFSAQQNAGGVTPPSGFRNYLGFTTVSPVTVAAGDFFWTDQRIEGYNIADLNWGTASAQTVTLSFWVRSSLTGTFGGALQNSNSTRSYPFSYTISAANTWEQKTITIAGDTTGTWQSTTSAGIVVMFGLGVGSTYSGPAGSWAATNYISATGATSVVGTNGATFYITGVQLEAGSVATPFEARDYGRELIMCQRYYFKNKSLSASYAAFTSGVMYAADLYLGYSVMPVTMRSAPSFSYSALGDFDLVTGGVLTPTGITIEGAASNSVRIYINTSGGTSGYAAYVQAKNTANAFFAFSAEL